MANRIFITGLPGSGTTFAARWLQEAGLPLDGPYSNDSDRKGLEWLPAATLLEGINGDLIPYFSLEGSLAVVQNSGAFERLRESWRGHIEGLDWPEVVKLAGCEWAGRVFLPLIEPELTIVVTRPLLDWAASNLAGRANLAPDAEELRHVFTLGAHRQGVLFDTLEHYVDTRVLLIRYPDAAQDADEAASAMLELQEHLHPMYGLDAGPLQAAWERAVNPDYIGYAVREGRP